MLLRAAPFGQCLDGAPRKDIVKDEEGEGLSERGREEGGGDAASEKTRKQTRRV